MAQSEPITIQGWQKGIGASPYVGFGRMVGLDIFRRPGIIQPGVRLDLLQIPSTSLTGLVTAEASDTAGNQFLGCSDGTLYKNGALFHTADGPIHDLLIVQDYLIISKKTNNLDLYGPISIGAGYTSAWKSGLSNSVSGYKKMFLGQDNVVYIGNEGLLASIIGFSAGTGTLQVSCVSTGLPNGEIVQTICELNRYVVISCSNGTGQTGNTKIYFMDRGILDALQTSFSLSIGVNIPERIVSQMITQNNRVYFFGNDTGTVYTTNTTSYQALAVIPGRLQGQSYTAMPNAVALVNNEILFGIGGVFNSAYDTVYGVYSLRGTSLITKNIISSGEYGQTTNVTIGNVFAYNNGSYQVGWQTGASTFGIDAATTNVGSSYLCWFESPFYETGTAIKPRTFQTVQFNLGNNMVNGQGLKLYFRQASNASWVLYGTYTYASGTLTMLTTDGINPKTTSQSGTFNSFTSKMPQTLTTNLQIKVAFDTGFAPYGSNIELQSIILI